MVTPKISTLTVSPLCSAANPPMPNRDAEPVCDSNFQLQAASNSMTSAVEPSYAQRLFATPSAPRTLTAEQRSTILAVAHKWDGYRDIQYQRGSSSRTAIDCSHLVAKIYAEAGTPYPYTPSGGDWQAAGFEEIDLSEAQPGDMIVWDSHVGIVIDPEARTFIAISSTATTDPIRVRSFANDSDWGSQPYRIVQMQLYDS